MKTARSTTDVALLERFAATFCVLDETIAFGDGDPAAAALAVGPIDEYGWRRWEPRAVRTPPSALAPLYQKLPARFPPLYEELVLSYRWARVDLGLVTLLANPIAPDLSGLGTEIFSDPGLVETLVPNGLLQFGRAGVVDYDPICFDIRARGKGGEAPVVRVDHEQVLCHRRLRTRPVASTFRVLVDEIIAKAAQARAAKDG